MMSFIFAMALDSVIRFEWNPPPQYDHAYQGELILQKIHPLRVRVSCTALFKKHGGKPLIATNGCAWRSKDRKRCWVIIIDRPANGTIPANVLRHEIGHCNGWPASHPTE